MLGFVFENSVSKAVMDARPNPILKFNGLDEQVKSIKSVLDHIQTNLVQIRTNAVMPAMSKKAKVAEIN